METMESVLTSHPFFKGVHEWYVEQLSRYAKLGWFREGEYLIREGEAAERFFLILEGKVGVGITSNGVFSSIQTLHDHDIVGWSWLMPPHQWHFDAVAEGPVKAIILDGKYLRAKCEEDPKLGYELLKRLTRYMIQRINSLRQSKKATLRH